MRHPTGICPATCCFYYVHQAPGMYHQIPWAVLSQVYAADLQLYEESDPSSAENQQHGRVQIENCLDEVHTWMLKDQLKANDSKTKLTVVIDPRQQGLLRDWPVLSLMLGDGTVHAMGIVCNLGVLLDSQMMGGLQVSAIVKSCNFHLCQILCVQWYVKADTCQQAVLALDISRLDHCKSLLADSQESHLNRLQQVQNWTAKLITRPRVPCGQIVHITPILQQLHSAHIQSDAYNRPILKQNQA